MVSVQERPAIRLAIAEDHLNYRDMILRMLEPYAREVEVVREAGNARDAMALADPPAPDVILIDLRMPERGRTLGEKSCRYGVNAIREIKRRAPATKVIVMSTFGVTPQEYCILLAALQSGINGYITRRDELDGADLLHAIRRVLKGERYYGPIVEEPLRRLETLSPREAEIFELLARRYTNEMIAERLSITVGTIKIHVSRILSKLDLRSREDISPRNDPLFFSEGRGNREEGTGNREQGTGKREAGSGKREAGSGKREAGSGNREQGTRKWDASNMVCVCGVFPTFPHVPSRSPHSYEFPRVPPRSYEFPQVPSVPPSS